MEYTATVELAATHEHADQILDELADYHPAVAVLGSHRLGVTITVPADSLRQAVTTALGIVEAQTGLGRALAVAVLDTEEWDRRQGFEPVPPLMSLAEASELLGISRQAVAQQIERNVFASATRVGTTWALSRAEVERRANGEATQPPAPAPDNLVSGVSMETATALKNYDWLMRNKEGTALHWEVDTVSEGEGGATIAWLTEVGVTPATRD